MWLYISNSLGSLLYRCMTSSRTSATILQMPYKQLRKLLQSSERESKYCTTKLISCRTSRWQRKRRWERSAKHTLQLWLNEMVSPLARLTPPHCFCHPPALPLLAVLRLDANKAALVYKEQQGAVETRTYLSLNFES